MKLAARLVVVDPYKIADLQENDTDAHTEDLSSILPPGTKAVLINVERMSGSGTFVVYPNSHATFIVSLGNTHNFLFTIPVKNRELKWANTVANDDWDLNLLGYFVQKRTR